MKYKRRVHIYYLYEEFEKGMETLKAFCSLRSESIRMHLVTGETKDNMNYIDASNLTLSDMGSMGGKGGFTPNMNGVENVVQNGSNMILFTVSVIVLLIGLAIVKAYKY